MKLFFLGAIGYPALELLYRQRTHWSMALAGGAACSLIGRIGRMRAPRVTRALLCGAGITGVEYLVGCLWNRDYSVWDYRDAALNWQGQVCLPFSLVWCALSYGMLYVMDRVRK